MNVTELARKVKVPTEQLREMLPQLGFDVGKKAIKIDDVQAHRIIQNWSKLKRHWDFEQAKFKKQQEELLAIERGEVQKIVVTIPEYITVRDFAKLAQKPVSIVIAQLMKNGIFASLNEKIDFDTASVIGDDLYLDVQKLQKEGEETTPEESFLEALLKNEDKTQLQPRPPVVVVMGHVDHGKTLLLDAIRTTEVAAGEAGGITQSIGAYQVEKEGHIITFIDTPGHEAFTAMRSRGARIADIAILVVAADDSVKPQTIEALKIIEAAKLPIIVAINKIDKPEANIDRVKQDLSKYNLIPEDWGGKTLFTEVSALKGQGIDTLLEMILLVSEMERDTIVANPDREAVGTIIESHIDKHEGPVATLLVQAGTLRQGDSLVNKDILNGKVRAMRDWKNQDVSVAVPSMPVKILGFKVLPKVGDVLEVVSGDLKKYKKSSKKQHRILQSESSIVVEKKPDEDGKKGFVFNMLIKADVLGMLEAIEESLEKIEQEGVKISIVSKGLGNITENDVIAAENSSAFLVGFNVRALPSIVNLAQEKNVEIHEYKIIYKLIEEVKERISELIEPEIIIVEVGRLDVLALFQEDKKGQVVGGRVISGEIRANHKVEVLRDGIKLVDGEITELQSGKEQVSVVQEGQDCGIRFNGDAVIEVGDVIRIIEEEKKHIKL